MFRQQNGLDDPMISAVSIGRSWRTHFKTDILKIKKFAVLKQNIVLKWQTKDF